MDKEIEIKVKVTMKLHRSLSSELTINTDLVLLYGEFHSKSSIEINELKSEINDFCDEQ